MSAGRAIGIALGITVAAISLVVFVLALGCDVGRPTTTARGRI